MFDLQARDALKGGGRSGSHGSGGDGLEGAGDEAALGSFGQQTPQDIVCLGEDAAIEVILQVIGAGSEGEGADGRWRMRPPRLMRI